MRMMSHQVTRAANTTSRVSLEQPVTKVTGYLLLKEFGTLVLWDFSHPPLISSAG